MYAYLLIDMRKYGVSGPYKAIANRVTRFGTAIDTTAALQECEPAAAPATITRRMPAAMKLLKVLTAVPRTEACAISLKSIFDGEISVLRSYLDVLSVHSLRSAWGTTDQ